MRFGAINTAHLGPVVAMQHATQGMVVQCECLTMQAAHMEAMRLNSQDMALEHIRQRDALRQLESQSQGPRRSVRFFESEDIHG